VLKILRSANGDVVLTVSGRLETENVGDLSAMLAREGKNQTLVLDLKDVVLVDRDSVRFLREREHEGITLRNCPLYIREWITRDSEEP